MEVYKFKLQKLLDIRLDKEENSKLIFKDAQKERNAAESKLNILKENYKKYNKVDSKASLIEQKIKQNYLSALSKNINSANLELIEKERILNEKREDLKQKQVDRKTVEVLKDKQKTQFYKDLDQKEQRENDEFALYGFIRNKEGR